MKLNYAKIAVWTTEDDGEFANGDYWRMTFTWYFYFKGVVTTVTNASTCYLYKVEWMDGIPTVMNKVCRKDLPPVHYLESNASDALLTVTAIGKEEETEATVVLQKAATTNKDKNKVWRGWHSNT
ncbi:hypothetical protein ACA910_010563 [Epithemia clementina (nom. ined.)]